MIRINVDTEGNLITQAAGECDDLGVELGLATAMLYSSLAENDKKAADTFLATFRDMISDDSLHLLGPAIKNGAHSKSTIIKVPADT